MLINLTIRFLSTDVSVDNKRNVLMARNFRHKSDSIDKAVENVLSPILFDRFTLIPTS